MRKKYFTRGTFVNELELIKGIGKSTADNLLKKYRSVKNIKELSLEDLSNFVGKSKARIIFDQLNKKEETTGSLSPDQQG